ncbi:MAG TPA: hypothetical protein VGC79_15940, partial [Polyangiaceae bacterium]
PPPGKLPDVRGLPEAARRINGAMLWMLGEEVSAPPTPSVSTERSTLRGLAVVATSNGTSTLVDGEEVVVDGNHGTVERVAPPPTSSGQHSNLSVN